MTSPFFRAAAACTEQLRQFATGSKQEHPDATFTKTKRGRYFAMVGALDIGQPHHLALLRSEPREHARHVEPQRNIRFRRATRVHRFVSAPDLMPPAPPIIDDETARHPKKKGAQLLRIVSGWRRSHEPQITFLHDVVGVRRIPEHTRAYVRKLPAVRR